MEDERRILGLGVMFLGIGLLCFTFYLAYSTFMGPESLASFLNLVPSESRQWGPILKISAYGVAIGLLLVMGSVGGRIVKAGLDLYSTE